MHGLRIDPRVRAYLEFRVRARLVVGVRIDQHPRGLRRQLCVRGDVQRVGVDQDGPLRHHVHRVAFHVL